MILDPVALPVDEVSRVGEARRLAASLTAGLGFDETLAGKVALVVTEAANNLALHATGGEILLRSLRSGETAGVEILALDRGPGMENVQACMRDGHSTAGTAGEGLGAIARLADLFELYSRPGQGTVLVAQLWNARTPPSPVGLEVGMVCLPKSGEEVAGDAWAVLPGAERSRVMVADGLGHGVTAAEASRAAVRVFADSPERTPREVLEAAHAALRSTRGAAAAIAEVRPDRGEILFAGIGNISGSVVAAEGSHHMVSHNGTVGHQLRKVQEFSYAWGADRLLVMHSDGLSTSWKLDSYPGLRTRHPALIAGVLYRDFCRGRDDVTVLAARAAGGGG